MREYMYGSGALKYEQAEKPKKKVKRGVSKKAQRRQARSNILCIITVTVLAFVLLARYACITEKSAQITKLEAEYETANSVVVQKQFELEQNIDLKKVEQIATLQLGMQRPEKHQLVYIDMKNSDYTETKPTGNSQGGFFASIAGGVNNIVEYFR